MNPNFGARRVRGKKTFVFGILERHGKVYTGIVPNAAKKPTTGRNPGPRGHRYTTHSDGWRGYDGLVDRGYKKHFHVNHGQHGFARGNCPINGIESFWPYAKRRLAKLNSVPQNNFSSKPERILIQIKSSRRKLNMIEYLPC